MALPARAAAGLLDGGAHERAAVLTGRIGVDRLPGSAKPFELRLRCAADVEALPDGREVVVVAPQQMAAELVGEVVVRPGEAALTSLVPRGTLHYMVERSVAVEDRLDSLFHALASAPRRDLLRRLSEGECTISELVEPSDMSFSNVSKHIQVLESAGLIHRRKEGRTYICGLNGEALAKAAAWLHTYEDFWTTQFDSLELSFIAEREEKAAKAKQAKATTADVDGKRPNGRKR